MIKFWLIKGWHGDGRVQGPCPRDRVVLFGPDKIIDSGPKRAPLEARAKAMTDAVPWCNTEGVTGR